MSIIKYISASQVDTLTKCGEMWRQRYVLGHKSKPGIALLVGSSTDESINTNLRHKVMNDGALISIEEASDIAADSFDRRVLFEGVSIFKEDGTLTEQKGAGKDKAVRLARLHHEVLAPVIRPKSAAHIQRRWRLAFDGIDADLVGITDVQEEIDEHTDLIRDEKTTGKTPSADAAEKSFQLKTYALAVKVIDKKSALVQLDFMVDQKKKGARVEIRKGGLVTDFTSVMLRFKAAYKAITKGVFLPARPDDWWCSRRWCGYYGTTCPYTTKGVKR